MSVIIEAAQFGFGIFGLGVKPEGDGINFSAPINGDETAPITFG